MKRNQFLYLILGAPLTGQVASPQKQVDQSRSVSLKPVTGADTAPRVGPGPSGRRRALCIGNNAYRFAVPLQNASRDATDVERSLQAAGFETTLVTEASLARMAQAIQKFTDATMAGDCVFFFYAGHGFQLEGANVLAPTDFNSRDEDSAKMSALHVESVLQGLVRKRAHLAVTMLDACRNNPFRDSTAPPGLAPVPPTLGTLAMFATAAGKTADDNPQGHNGLFTSKLLEGFTTGMPLQALVRKVRDDVFEVSGGRQRPYVQEDLVGDFYFHPPAAAGQAGAGSQPERASTDALLAEGLNLYRAGDFDAAYKTFDKVVKIDPANVYAWNAGGAALAQLGRKAQAVELYGHAIQVNPAYVAAFVNRGLAYLAALRYEQAIQDFTWAIEEDSANPLLYQWRGQAYLGVRRYQEGLVDLDKAVSLDAGSPDSFMMRSRLNRRLGQNERALADVNQALRLKRNSWQAFEERAAVYRALEQRTKAEADDKVAAAIKARQ